MRHRNRRTSGKCVLHAFAYFGSDTVASRVDVTGACAATVRPKSRTSTCAAARSVGWHRCLTKHRWSALRSTHCFRTCVLAGNYWLFTEEPIAGTIVFCETWTRMTIGMSIYESDSEYAAVSTSHVEILYLTMPHLSCVYISCMPLITPESHITCCRKQG